MKIKLLFLSLMMMLTACQPIITPTPEIREVTRIVEQTVEVPQIVKETVVVTQLVTEPTPTPTKFWDTEYNLPAEYFDAMLVVVQFYTFLETKQCEEYYDLFSEWRKSIQISKESQIELSLSPSTTFELLSVIPYNYKLVSEGRNPINEPEDLIFFVVSIKENYASLEYYIYVWISVVLEDGEWKIGKGGTSPPQYGDEYLNR